MTYLSYMALGYIRLQIRVLHNGVKIYMCLTNNSCQQNNQKEKEEKMICHV